MPRSRPSKNGVSNNPESARSGNPGGQSATAIRLGATAKRLCGLETVD